MDSLTVEYKGARGRFASLQSGEVAHVLSEKFSNDYTVGVWSQSKDHTKAAQKVGGGHQYRITLRSNTPVMLSTGDVVFPQIVLRDRTYPGSALTVEFGLWRQVCSNGLMSFKSVATPIRVPHFRNQTDTLRYLDQVIGTAAIKFADVLRQAEASSRIVVSNPLYVITQLNLPPTLTQTVTERIQAGMVRPEDNVNTVWGLYNLVNELDRVKARKNSTAYLDRDTDLMEAITAIAT